MAHKSDMVVLIRVTPDGKAEQYLMKNWSEIKEKTKFVESAVQLSVFFPHLITGFGDRYNQYVLNFDNEDDAMKAQTYVSDVLWKLLTEYDGAWPDGEMSPEAVFARERVEES